MITEEEKKLIESIEKDIKSKKIMSIIRISVAIGLILCVAWFGWVNYIHANDIRLIMSEHGDLGFCYLCGYENLRSCSCMMNYNDLEIDEDYKINLGLKNVQKCLDNKAISLGNISIIP